MKYEFQLLNFKCMIRNSTVRLAVTLFFGLGVSVMSDGSCILLKIRETDRLKH